ncbi:MAG: hypothetical protein V9F04_08870 [Dermatophilaceae bacterium]
MTTIAARRRFETRPQRARRRSLTFEVSRARSLRSTWVLLVLGAAAGATTLVSGSLADLTEVAPSPADAISVLTSATSGASLVCGIFGALSAGHEYRYGLFGLSATLFPRRSDLLVGKVLGALAFAVLTCSAALVVGLGALWLTGKDHLVSAITSEPGTALLASGRSIVVCVGYLLIGIASRGAMPGRPRGSGGSAGDGQYRRAGPCSRGGARRIVGLRPAVPGRPPGSPRRGRDPVGPRGRGRRHPIGELGLLSPLPSPSP